MAKPYMTGIAAFAQDAITTELSSAGTKADFQKASIKSTRINGITEVQLQQRNIVIIVVVMMFFLSMAATGALYKQRKVQQHINKLLLEKNEQILMQSEEIQVQAEEVHKLNEDLECLNQNLENKIRSRTKMLRDQNNLLAEYAYSNAHELRAPVASVMGLVDLLKRSKLAHEEKEILDHLGKSVSELALVVKDIRIKLERNDIFFFEE